MGIDQGRYQALVAYRFLAGSAGLVVLKPVGGGATVEARAGCVGAGKTQR